DAGFSPEEIQQWSAEQSGRLREAGFGDAEIRTWFGQKPEPDHEKANTAFASTLAEATKREPQKEAPQEPVGGLYAANLPMEAVKGSVESVLNIASGFTFGFPAYLGGGLGTVMARD